MDRQHFDFKTPFNPEIIKKMSEKELYLLSDDIREYIIKICSINGGHLASNLGVVELTISLFKAFDFPNDKLILDVGHQCYTHKILSGRNLEHLRKEDGINGFQKKDESIYDCYEAGHSSTSISASMGMALERDLNKENYHVIALIGDSSIANGLSLEALNHLASFKHKVIIIINDNDMSISKPIGAMHNFLEKARLSKNYLRNKARYRKLFATHKLTSPFYKATRWIKNSLKYRLLRGNIFTSLDCYYISKVDGHDFRALSKALEMAKRAPKSVIIHVTTTKGKGYQPAENDSLGVWHGVGSFDIESGLSSKNKKEDIITWSDIYASLLDKELERNPKAILVNPATAVGSKLSELILKYPDRSFDVGIAEEHAAIFASGSASGSLHPYLSVYSTFLQRSYDEIQQDIARMNLPVTMLIDRAGLVGEDGETHQGIFDSSFLLNMPNVAIAMAKDINEATQLFSFAKDYHHPLAIRYPRSETLNKIEESLKPLKYGEWKIEQDGNDVALITYGPIIDRLMGRIDNSIKVINAIFQKPINLDYLKDLLDYKTIIIYDVYGIKEGFGYHLLGALHDLNYKGEVILKCLPNAFIRCGSIEQQLKRYGLDSESIINFVNGMVKK